MTAMDQDTHLLLRVKEDTDNVEPSASSVAALNLLRLAQYTDRKDYQEMAEKTLKSLRRHDESRISPRAHAANAGRSRLRADRAPPNRHRCCKKRRSGYC